MRARTYEDAINRLAERTNENRQELRKSKFQRRTEFTDLYGVPFTAQGDADNPATFYISISPDLIYFLRFQFKLSIEPMVSTVSGSSVSIDSVGSTSLSDSADIDIEEKSTIGITDDGISPNPHSHSASGSGSIGYGIHFIHTTSDDFTIKIHGVDITNYLIEQQDGDWIDGEGIYPTNRNDDETDFYDLLDVATVMYAEGNESDAEKLLKAEFKKVEITSDAPFQATMYLYMKYTIMGR